MSLINVSEGQGKTYSGTATPGYVRLFLSKTFTNSDGVRIHGSSLITGRKFYRQIPVTFLDGTYTIQPISGDDRIDSTTDGRTSQNAYYTVVLYSTTGKKLDVVYPKIKVPATPTTTSWEDLEFYTTTQERPVTSDLWTLINAFFSNLSIAGIANTLTLGKLRISFAADDGANPIAVSISDPIYKTILQRRALREWASLSAALTALGSVTPVELIISDAITISANTSIPANVRIVPEGNPLITVNSGVTLTIGSMADPGNKKIFAQQSVTSNIRFSVGAVNKINIAWFVGAAGACTNAVNQAIASCTANGGGEIFFPQGDWITRDHAVCSNLIITGTGKDTVIKNSSATNGIFTHGANVYDVVVRDLTLDGEDYSSAGYVCSAAYGAGSAGRLRLENVTIQKCLYGFRIYDTASTEWQMAAVSFDAKCRFSDNTYGVWCNSINSVAKCDAFFEVGANQWAGYFVSTGQWTFTANEFAGSPYLGTNQIESQTIVAAAGVTVAGIGQSVVTASGMTGSPKTVDVPLDTTMTTATLIATAFRKYLGADPSVTTFFHIGGTGADVQLIALDPAANAASMNFTINTGTATGITNSATSTNTAAGVADTTQAQGFYFQGAHGTINFIGTVDEGFRNFIVNDASDLNSIINFKGASIASAIRLNGSCTLNTEDCWIIDRSIRDSAASGSQYTSKGDVVPSFSYFGGAFRTLSARATHNFNGDPLVGSSRVGLEVNSYENRISSHYSGRFYNNDVGFFEDRTRGRVEAMSGINPSGGVDFPLLILGRCTQTGEPLYVYTHRRNYTTGRYEIVGSQTGFIGLDFNGDIVATGFLANSPTIGIGYGTGAGGSVVQATNKTTGVTLNTPCGKITMNNAALADATSVTFTVSNSTVALNDVPTACHASAGTAGAYQVEAHSPATGSFKITVRNISGGSLSQAIVLNFAVIKSVIN